MALTFTDEPLAQVIATLEARLETLGAGEWLSFFALEPDLGVGLFAGEGTEVGGVRYRHRPLRVWLELAERLGCRLHTPERGVEPSGAGGVLVKLSLSKLRAGSWHGAKGIGEKGTGEEGAGEGAASDYGHDSEFARVQKLEEPTFWLDYTEALARTALAPKGRVLSLGVGRGDELIPFRTLFAGHNLSFTGIDRSVSALQRARERFPGEAYRFIRADLGDLGRLELGRFELVVSVATFQSPGVRGHTLIHEVVQHHLTERGSLVIALPNCRYRGGEVVYGAKLKNFSQPDLSLVVKDLAFYRKYLQQHRFRVFITGKYYLFLTAVRP